MNKIYTLVGLLSLMSFPICAQNALDFDGIDDYVQTSCQGVTGSSNRTFEAWVYVPQSAPATNLCILDYGNNTAGDRNTFVVSGTRELRFISGGTNANINTAPNAVPEDQWAHVAFVLNGGTGYLYVNGVQQATGSLSSVSTPTTGTDVRIGERVSGGSIPFMGALDEVRMWSVARSSSEIQADMNAELCGMQTNLLLYLKLNEGTAGGNNVGVNTTADNSGNGFSGTLNGFALSGPTSNWVTGAGLPSLSTTSSVTESACGSYSLTPTSTVYTSSGIYTETLFGANAAGCDSIVTLDLTINNTTSGNDIQSACNSFTWINGVTYTSSTTATHVLTNSAGCDSLVFLDLTINNNTGTDVQTACDSYTWIDGNTYTSSNNTATVTLTNAAGCDSVVTLDLTISNSNSGTDTQSACNSFTWIDGNTYTSSNNTATFTLQTTEGCDSIVTLNLTIDAISSAVTQSATGEVLTADQVGANYQWVECPSMTPITGANSQSYSPTNNGEYAVVVMNGQCSDTSSCFTVSTVSVEENNLSHISLYPNPSSGDFTIDFGDETSEVAIEITNVMGEIVFAAVQQDMQQVEISLRQPSGIYFVTISSKESTATLRYIKK